MPNILNETIKSPSLKDITSAALELADANFTGNFVTDRGALQEHLEFAEECESQDDDVYQHTETVKGNKRILLKILRNAKVIWQNNWQMLKNMSVIII